MKRPNRQDASIDSPRELKVCFPFAIIGDIDSILNMLAKHAILTRIHYLWRPQLRDPNDDMILELAISGNAGAIVTFNQKDFIIEKSGFNIQIITPGQYYKQCL